VWFYFSAKLISLKQNNFAAKYFKTSFSVTFIYAPLQKLSGAEK